MSDHLSDLEIAVMGKDPARGETKLYLVDSPSLWCHARCIDAGMLDCQRPCGGWTMQAGPLHPDEKLRNCLMCLGE